MLKSCAPPPATLASNRKGAGLKLPALLPMKNMSHCLKSVSIIFLLLTGNFGICQSDNLVINGSFERLNTNGDGISCRYMPNSNTFVKHATDWQTYGGMTPDLIVWRPDDFGNCFFPKPHSGEGAIGMITYLPAVDLGKFHDYHEYIFGRLRFPMEAGQAYEVSMYIQQADSTAIDHLEVLYTEGHPILPTAAGNLGVCFLYREARWEPKGGYQPQVLFKDPIVTKHGEWVKISQTFVADRAYLFFGIGNFFKDTDTRTTLPNSAEIDSFNLAQEGFAEKWKRIAYYCIDDISVTPVETPTAKSVITKQLEEKSIYTFENVNFETAKWDLLPEALPELKALAEYLLEHPEMKVEIAGHTDAVGKDEDNRILSEKRAEAVCKYLIFRGVAEERLKFQGYGESQPVAPNDTPKGRAANRRVECRIR